MRKKQRPNTVLILNPEPGGKNRTSLNAARALERRGHLEFSDPQCRTAQITERGVQARYGSTSPDGFHPIDQLTTGFHWAGKSSGEPSTGYFRVMQAQQGISE